MTSTNGLKVPETSEKEFFSGGVDLRQFEQYHYVTIPFNFVRIDHFSKRQIQLKTRMIVNELDQLPNKDVIILLNVEEESSDVIGPGMSYWCDHLTSLLNSRPSINYVILTNDTFEHADKYSNVLRVNWFLLQTVSMYSQTDNVPWEPTNTDVLFLPGKPWKPSRLPALTYFLRSSLSNNLKYSSLTFEQMMEWGETNAQRLLDSWQVVYNDPAVDLNIIRDIMDRIAKVYDMPWDERDGHRDFRFLNPKMYSNIGVEIIAETAHNNSRFITEKTYKSIVLGYPFVFIHNNFLRTILTQGFKIYQPILKETPDSKNGQRDWSNEFETCIKNTEKVLNSTQEEISLLKVNIKWNQQHAMIVYYNTLNNITKIIPNFFDYAGEIFCKTVRLQEEKT